MKQGALYCFSWGVSTVRSGFSAAPLNQGPTCTLSRTPGESGIPRPLMSNNTENTNEAKTRRAGDTYPYRRAPAPFKKSNLRSEKAKGWLVSSALTLGDHPDTFLNIQVPASIHLKCWCKTWGKISMKAWCFQISFGVTLPSYWIRLNVGNGSWECQKYL